jgi:hypothetical protein
MMILAYEYSKDQLDKGADGFDRIVKNQQFSVCTNSSR